MLTRQGWVVALLSVSAIVAGRVLGVLELLVLGVTAGTLLLAVLLRAVLVRLEVGVRRDVHPPRVHAGSPSRIDLEVRNLGARGTPLLRIRDAVSGTAGADLGLAPLAVGESSTASYHLPTERRGILTIGPLELLISDPFGLTELRVPGAGTTELTVYPRIDHLAALPETAGHDPEATNQSPTSIGRAGEEFFALRPFEIGDELRRVHWPSTARFDELLVRQTELPWQGRLTVLLDLRNDTQTEASLDIAVSAAASLVTAARNQGDLFRLVCTDGVDSGFVPGNAAYGAVLEHLATVATAPSGNLARLLDSLARSSAGGALVVVAGPLASHDRQRIETLRSRFSTLTYVQVQPSSWNAHRAQEEGLPAPSLREVNVTRETPFAAAWNAGVAGRFSTRSGRRRRLGARARP